MSTSVHRSFADGWAAGRNTVTLDIKMVANHCANFYGRGMNAGEGEILLPRGNTYRITGSTMRGNRRVVNIDIVGGSSKAE
jgi:hypothetical protein